MDFFKTIFFLICFQFLIFFGLFSTLLPRDFPRDSIYHDTPKVFPHFFILKSSRTSKEGFLFPMVSLVAPLENGEGMKPLPLVEVNPNMLVRDVERMCAVHRLLIGC